MKYVFMPACTATQLIRKPGPGLIRNPHCTASPPENPGAQTPKTSCWAATNLISYARPPSFFQPREGVNTTTTMRRC